MPASPEGAQPTFPCRLLHAEGLGVTFGPQPKTQCGSAVREEEAIWEVFLEAVAGQKVVWEERAGRAPEGPRPAWPKASLH